ncbi:MAG: gliding motility lipoprotein GldD [Bacteroidia bacterium]|nr:gliding motility lipoprotein GldD [Bacteroidia bacterium]
MVALMALNACDKTFVPKPVGYNRFVLPDPAYTPLPDTLPYTFEYSAYAHLLRDTSAISDRFWVEINYPDIKGNIHVTYKKIHHSEKLLHEFLNDSYVLTAKHQIKAYAIDETIVKTPNGLTAVIAELDGEVPSQFQFTVTDSTENFIRGALYFKTKVANDSLAPAIEYVKKDIMHLINTLTWKNPKRPN